MFATYLHLVPFFSLPFNRSAIDTPERKTVKLDLAPAERQISSSPSAHRGKWGPSCQYDLSRTDDLGTLVSSLLISFSRPCVGRLSTGSSLLLSKPVERFSTGRRFEALVTAATVPLSSTLTTT